MFDDPPPDAVTSADPALEALIGWVREEWGTGNVHRAGVIIAHADEIPEEVAARFERSACTPHMAEEIIRRNAEIDVRDLLSTLHVPTLVVHAVGDPLVAVSRGRYLAAETSTAHALSAARRDACDPRGARSTNPSSTS